MNEVTNGSNVVDSDEVDMKEVAPGESMELDSIEVGNGGSGNDNSAGNGENPQIIHTEAKMSPASVATEDQWESVLKEVKEHITKHGSCNVLSKNDKRLYDWIYRQRRLQKDGKLSDERRKKLEDIGFTFEVEVDADAVSNEELRWNANLEQIKEHILKHGTSIVKSSAGNKSLCNWIYKQRSFYRKRKLPEERYKKLMDVGFDFERNLESGKKDSFQQRIEELQKHKTKTGTTKVKYSENRSLNRWLKTQCKLYTEGTLSVEKIDMLIDIGVSLDENDDDLKDGSYYTLPRANVSPLIITRESPLKIPVYTHHVDELIDGLGNGQMTVEEAIERLKKMRRLA
mmetsp:Transcript_11750/g.17236  ORF Transcript_11750/g.17236 Transcript_11750/m.17236 type:complete len:343 (+) Transcript_11750:3-1031(+)